MKRLAFLLLALACGAGSMPAWKTGQLTPEERASAKVVQSVDQATSQWRWDSSPWARPGDGVLVPVFLIIAQDRSACIVPAADWAIAQRGEHYPCTHWILYRG